MRHRIRAAALIVKDDSILLVRHMHPDTGEVWWVPPGGSVETADTSVFDCARRETFEETGLNVKLSRIVYIREFVDEENDAHNLELFINSTAYSGELTIRHFQGSGPDEHYIKDVGWVDKDDLRNLLIYPEILQEQAPDVFVCRTCGHAALGQAPDRCPDCSSWPGRFRKFVAFFNGDNQDPVNPIFVLEILEESVSAVKQLTAGLSEDAMNRKPSPAEWSIRDHLAHFYDTQEMLDNRVNLMLEYDDPDLTAYAVFELATETERHPQTAQGIVQAFSQKRLAFVKRLRARSLNDLYRTGQHPAFGQITILRQAAYMANHEQDHLPEIEALCWQVG